MVVLLLCLPNIDINVHVLISEESCLLFRIANDIAFNATIVVPPGLNIELYWRFDSEVQKLILELCQVLYSICFNIEVVNGLLCTLCRLNR